jgi:hypothetical protein
LQKNPRNSEFARFLDMQKSENKLYKILEAQLLQLRQRMDLFKLDLPMQFSKKYFNIGTSLEDGNYLHCFHLKR